MRVHTPYRYKERLDPVFPSLNDQLGQQQHVVGRLPHFKHKTQ